MAIDENYKEGIANVCIVVPCYNEEENIPVFYEQVKKVQELHKDINIKILYVDDHSNDNTNDIIKLLCQKDKHVLGLRLASNSGAHTACSAGIKYSMSDCIISMAADLQDPPEIIPLLVDEWRKGNKIVWAARRTHKRSGFLANFFAERYWYIMKRYILPATHPRGADLFLIDKDVAAVFNTLKERNRSVVALLTTFGYKQSTIEYDKNKRLHGTSSWSLSKKIKYSIDSMIGFSHLPMRIMTIFGMIVLFICFIYLMFLIYNAFKGQPVQGWTSTMVMILFMGGINMLFLGIIGEYLWRVLDEVRGRPFYIIEEKTNIDN